MKYRTCILFVFFVLAVPSVMRGSKTIRATLSVSHLTHDGKETRETRIHVMLDHTYYLELVNQVQPSGILNCREFMGVLSGDNFQQITRLMASPTFQNLRTLRTLVQVGDPDAWYIAVHRSETKYLVFSGHSSPPEGIVAWFDETKNLKPPHSIDLRPDYQCSFFSEEMAEAWSR
jgi:hypothetical protein